MSEPAVGELLCVGIRGAVPGESILERDLEACRRAGVGGVILFDVDVPMLRRLQAEEPDAEIALRRAPRNILDPEQVKHLVQHVRTRLGPQVFVSVDQEGGHVARLSPRRGFAADPSATELAAMEHATMLAAAKNQASRLRDLGFDLNFAPCVDLCIEPQSTIIARLGRCFGSDPERVVEVARVVLEAHAQAGVAACLKHFPGHGSSRGDTHLGMVDITDTWQPEDELAPYKALCGRPGVAVMVAHVIHRHLDAKLPASLSPNIIDGLLRRQIGFDGVVVTDSIDMRAIVHHFVPEGEANPAGAVGQAAGQAVGQAAGQAAGQVAGQEAGQAKGQATGRSGEPMARRMEASQAAMRQAAAGEAAVAAIEAGADLVVDGFNLDERPDHPAPVLVDALRAAVRDGRIQPERIEESARRLRRLRAEIGRAS